MYFIIFLINGLIIEFCVRTQHCGCAFNKIFRLARVGGSSLLKLLSFFVLTVTRHLKIFVKPVGVQLLPGFKKKKDTFNWLSIYRQITFGKTLLKWKPGHFFFSYVATLLKWNCIKRNPCKFKLRDGDIRSFVDVLSLEDKNLVNSLMNAY